MSLADTVRISREEQLWLFKWKTKNKFKFWSIFFKDWNIVRKVSVILLCWKQCKYNLDSEVCSYLFSFTIFIVNIGQDKINPAHSITEEHWVFTLLLFVNLQTDKSEGIVFMHIQTPTSLWMHSVLQISLTAAFIRRSQQNPKKASHSIIWMKQWKYQLILHIFTANTNNMLNCATFKTFHDGHISFIGVMYRQIERKRHQIKLESCDFELRVKSLNTDYKCIPLSTISAFMC